MASVANVRTDKAPTVEAISPSQAVVLDANRIEYVVDDLGRRLGVKRISASLRRKMFKALSVENGEKGAYLVMAIHACCCVSIDGDLVPFPTTELQIDALIDRLENEGLEAIGLTLATKFMVAKKDDDDLKNS